MGDKLLEGCGRPLERQAPEELGQQYIQKVTSRDLPRLPDRSAQGAPVLAPRPSRPVNRI